MPPLKTYKFKHIYSDCIDPINITIYGDINKAWDTLANYVARVKDWEYLP